MRGIFTFCLLLLAGATSVKASPNCIAKEDIAQFAGNFRQFQNLVGREYCADGSQTFALLEALQFMRRTRFEPSMPVSGDELFSGRFKNDWYGYFVQRITDIDVQTSCPRGVGAFVYMWGSTMYVCPYALTEAFTALDRASIFMHEARHIDGYPHVTCRSGPRAGLNGACDTRISEGGSYAVTVETYAQIAKYAPDLHPGFRAYARAASATYALEAFAETVRLQQGSSLLMLTENDRSLQRWGFAKNGEVQPMGELEQLGRLNLRALQMVLVPENRSENAQFVFTNNAGSIKQTPGLLVESYNQRPVAARQSFVDFHMGVQMAATIEQNFAVIECDPQSERTQRVTWAGGAAKGVLYPQGYNRGLRSVEIMTESGESVELGCDGSRRAYARGLGKKWDRPYQRIYQAGAGQIFGLLEGTMYSLSPDGRGEPLELQLGGRVYDFVPRQEFQFFDASL